LVISKGAHVGVDRQRADIGLGAAAQDHQPWRVEFREHPDRAQQHDDEQHALELRQRDVNEALPGIAAIDLGRVVQFLRNGLQPRQHADHDEGKELPYADDDQRHHDPVLAHEADRLVDKACCLDQVVDETELAVEQPFPDDHGDDGRHHIWKDHDRTQDVAAWKELVEQQSRSNTQYDLQHDRRKRIDRAAPYRRPEFRIAQKKNIVVESDESLLWEERVLVEEADPDAVQHRIKRKQKQEENGGQHQNITDRRLRQSEWRGAHARSRLAQCAPTSHDPLGLRNSLALEIAFAAQQVFEPLLRLVGGPLRLPLLQHDVHDHVADDAGA